MKKEKEKGIEELYNYLIKNKDKMSKEEYNDLKKDFEKSLFKLYSEKAISKEFLENYSQKIKESEKEEIEKERPSSKKSWPLVIGLIVIICVVAIGGIYLLWSGGETYTVTKTSIPPTSSKYLYDGTSTVWLGTTKDNTSELVRAVTTKNQETVNYLFSSGKAFSVPAYTKVIILEESLTLTKVRILEGKYKGKIGWTCYEWVK